MKRTKQVYHYDGGDNVPRFVSGCRQFDGEDVRKYTFKVALILNWRFL